MISSLEQFAARGVAAQKSADAIIAAAKSVLVSAKPNIATCHIFTTEPTRCPLCERIVQGVHECRRNPKGHQ